MTRVAVVVDRHFADRNVGVRNYVLAAAALVGRAARVDFVSYYRTESGRAMWFRLAFTRDPLRTVDGPVLRGSPKQVLAGLSEVDPGPPAVPEPPPAPGTVPRPPAGVAFTHLGDRLDREGYAAGLIAAPWAVDQDGPLPLPLTCGLAFDAIPCRYVLDNPLGRPFAAAAQHADGFRHYRAHCRTTFCISPPVAADLRELFHFPADRVTVLPPLLPLAYHDPAVPDVPREAAVVLASPLDPRKGLADLPGLLNPLAAAGVRVLGYGGVRCTRGELTTFFERLDDRLEVEWHPRASADAVKRLFARGRVLLFPSLAEGLGLPVLEAQVCGCRVLARPIDPVQGLLRAGQLLHPADPDAVRDAVFDAGFDHAGLRAAAAAEFRPDRVADVLLPPLGLDPSGTSPKR